MSWSKLSPEALAALIRHNRDKIRPGETIVTHDVACPLQVGEACNCEPIVVTASEGQS